MAMSEKARREVIAAAIKEVEKKDGESRTVPSFREGKEGPLPVILVKVSAVLFNPRSHRIKSQLESHPKRELVASDPYSDEAQEIIHEILKTTDPDAFDALKANLKDKGQQEPGVVTHDGLLVNANTRLGALRDLEEEYIRAILLPENTDEEEIDNLELELQVQRDFKQDYTFTNELIFIDELVKRDSVEKVAKRLNWAASADEKELKRGIKSVEQSVRLYARVRQIQKLSGGKVPLTFFDDKRQALIDLDDKYETKKNVNDAEAESLLEARTLGILTGTHYRELRKIDGEAAVEILVPRLEEKDKVGEKIPSLSEGPQNDDGEGGENDDSDLLLRGNEGEPKADLGPLVEVIAKSHGEDEIELAGEKVARDEVVQEIAEAIDETADEVESSKKAEKNISGPITQLNDAVKKAKAAERGFKQFHNHDGFNLGKFKYQQKKLEKECAALKKAIEQTEE